MKTNLLRTIALAMVLSLCYTCSTDLLVQPQSDVEPIQSTIELQLDEGDCNSQDPKTRITNNSNSVVNMEIKDADGALLNYVYGLIPGELSDWKAFPAGQTTFSITTVVSLKNIVIDMGTCMAYEVVIDVDHQLDTDIPIQL